MCLKQVDHLQPNGPQLTSSRERRPGTQAVRAKATSSMCTDSFRSTASCTVASTARSCSVVSGAWWWWWWGQVRENHQTNWSVVSFGLPDMSLRAVAVCWTPLGLQFSVWYLTGAL